MEVESLDFPIKPVSLKKNPQSPSAPVEKGKTKQNKTLSQNKTKTYEWALKEKKNWKKLEENVRKD